MDKKKKRVIFLICFVLIALVAIFGGIKIYQQRELNLIMEQEQLQQERLNHLYISLNRNRPLHSDDPMEIPRVVIGLAGLRSIGFSREEVEEIYINSEAFNFQCSDRNHPDYWEVSTFIIEGGARDFGNALNRIYHANFETISTQFPQFELIVHDDSTSLPLPVVEELIRLYETENPPQPRAVVVQETETEDSP